MLKKSLLVMGLVSAAAASTATLAAEEFQDDRFYIAPFGSFIQPGGDRDAQSGWGGGLGIGKIINEYFNVELRGFWNGLDRNQHPGRTDLTGGTADLQYYFFRDTFSPYAVMGIGGMNTSNRGSDRGGPSYRKSSASVLGEAGVGFTYELADNFLLRSDVRYRYSWEGSSGAYPREDDFHDLVVNAGFVIPFGDKPTTAIATAAPVDECAGKDSDGDGVGDCEDKCPSTMAGSKVDDQGCPIKIELKGVNFKYNSAELTENAKVILDGVAEELIAYPLKKDIEVQGHTSSEGTNAYNMKLSFRRSQSVADYLKRKGVSNTLMPKGYGEDYPIAENKTEGGRSQNRRVELIWMGD